MHIALGREIEEARVAEMRAKFPDVTFSPIVAEPDGIRDADGFVGRIPAEVYAKAGPNLRWVHSTGAGIETIVAIPELVASQVVVTNTRGAHAPFVAEHAFALLLSLGRHLYGFAHDQGERVYRSYGRDVPMYSVYGKRMLILGMGNIGRAIARRALAFDMEVVGLDLMAPEETTGDLRVLSMEHLDLGLPSGRVVLAALYGRHGQPARRPPDRPAQAGCGGDRHLARAHHRRGRAGRTPARRLPGRRRARCLRPGAAAGGPFPVGCSQPGDHAALRAALGADPGPGVRDYVRQYPALRER